MERKKIIIELTVIVKGTALFDEDGNFEDVDFSYDDIIEVKDDTIVYDVDGNMLFSC